MAPTYLSHFISVPIVNNKNVFSCFHDHSVLQTRNDFSDYISYVNQKKETPA